jgi:hypothetical protein
MKLREFLLFIFLSSSVALFAQQSNVPLSREYLSGYVFSLEKLDVNFHSSAQPFLRAEFDTVAHSSFDTLFHFSTSGNITVSPVIDFAFTKDLRNDTSFFAPGIGIRMGYQFQNKLFAGGEIFTQNGSFPSITGRYMDSMSVSPGNGYAHGTTQGYSITPFSYYLSWSPGRIFNLQAGTGKHFWGDGHRSLLLSDNSYNYPYFRLTTTFWRVKYINLFAMMNDISTANGDPSQFKRKYASMHYLNWNISRRVSLGIFEAVIWQAQDTLLNRQFDVHYLNPFVFYRPVEYSLGSADNSLIGINLKVKINDHFQVYGQVLLDEFLLDEVVADTGWWANKYGFQLGAKVLEPFGVKNLFVQAEFNVVRPFTYSHGEIIQNYAHYNEPLAHPLGANFREWIGIIRYSVKNFQVDEHFTWASYGTDTSYFNFGGNLYQSYSFRYQDYHNYVGQGLSNELFYNRVRVSWILDPAINLRAYLQHTFRQVRNIYGTRTENYIHIGISSLLWNQYTDR